MSVTNEGHVRGGRKTRGLPCTSFPFSQPVNHTLGATYVHKDFLPDGQDTSVTREGAGDSHVSIVHGGSVGHYGNTT